MRPVGTHRLFMSAQLDNGMANLHSAHVWHTVCACVCGIQCVRVWHTMCACVAYNVCMRVYVHACVCVCHTWHAEVQIHDDQQHPQIAECSLGKHLAI